MIRINCRACYSTSLTTFLSLGLTPLADSFIEDEKIIEDSYPLELAVCTRCWWVQITEDVPGKKLFGPDYAFFTGASPSLVEHFHDYADSIIRDFPEYYGGSVIDIASNDGTFLKFFKRAGYRVLGIDPAGPPVEAAIRDGIPTHQVPFREKTAQGIAQADIVTANNVMAHVSDPEGFLTGIKMILKPKGIAIIEFQYFPNLLINNEYDNVYHEHRSYISLLPFRRLCSRVGLDIFDVKEVGTQGGSIRVFLAHKGKRKTTPAVDEISAREMVFQAIDPYLGFQHRINWLRHKLVSEIRNLKRDGFTIAGYGASAKSCTLLNSCGITDELDYIEDTTPYKIGKLAPGSHIPVIGPGQRRQPDVYLLLIWNYLDGVLGRERAFREKGGKFLLPLPQVRLI